MQRVTHALPAHAKMLVNFEKHDRLQLAAEAIHDISETADFGDRCALRRYHYDVHFAALNLSATRESGKGALFCLWCDQPYQGKVIPESVWIISDEIESE